MTTGGARGQKAGPVVEQGFYKGMCGWNGLEGELDSGGHTYPTCHPVEDRKGEPGGREAMGYRTSGGKDTGKADEGRVQNMGRTNKNRNVRRH